MLERDTNSLERLIKHGCDFGFHLSCFCSYKTCSRGILLLLMSVRRLVNLGGMPQTFCIVHRIQLTLRSTFYWVALHLFFATWFHIKLPPSFSFSIIPSQKTIYVWKTKNRNQTFYQNYSLWNEKKWCSYGSLYNTLNTLLTNELSLLNIQRLFELALILESNK